MVFSWSDERLNRLYFHYNRRFWRSKLPQYKVRGTKLEDALGTCDTKNREILIDVSALGTDKKVRSTLLHEMVHVAAKDDCPAHGARFWRELEHLLSMNAPITISFSEAPGFSFIHLAVPRRFKRCQQLTATLMKKEEKRISRWHIDGEFEIDDEYVYERFEDAGLQLSGISRSA